MRLIAQCKMKRATNLILLSPPIGFLTTMMTMEKTSSQVFAETCLLVYQIFGLWENVRTFSLNNFLHFSNDDHIFLILDVLPQVDGAAEEESLNDEDLDT